MSANLITQLTAGSSCAYMFDELAHAGLRDTAPAEDLHRVRGGVLCAARHVRLEEGDLPRKLAGLLLVRLCIQTKHMRCAALRSGVGGKTNHVAHLVRDVLEPALLTLHPRDHERELAANDSQRV